MIKRLAAVLLALVFATQVSAQAISVSPSGGGGTPGGAANTVQYNNAGAFGGMSGTSWDDTNRSLTVTGATVTANHPILELSQTWNNAAVPFTGISLVVTETAALGGSNLLSLVRGTNSFVVDRNASIVTPGLITITSNTSTLRFRNGATTLSSPATADTQLGAADAAAPVAQTLNVQSVSAGTSNTAGANWTIQGSAGTGTGAGGSIIFKTAPAGTTGTAQNAYVDAVTIDSPGTLRVKGFTVATLPAAGTAGRMAYVSDQLTACPALGGTFTGGGAVVCKAFDDGTNWTHQ